MASRHPNFPDKINIHASRPPRITEITSSVEDDWTFGSESQEMAIKQFGIAGRVWEAAYLLTHYLRHPNDVPWQFDPPCTLFEELDRPLCVIELGSGTGYVGINLARNLFIRSRTRDDLIVLTDLPDVCSLLTDNVRNESRKWSSTFKCAHNKPDNLIVQPLPWGSKEAISALADVINLTSVSRQSDGKNQNFITHIICSDLVYFPHLLAPLLRSLIAVTSPPFISGNNSPEVILSYEVRSLIKETPFWSAFGLWFSFRPLLFRDASQLADYRLNGSGMRESTSWRRFGFQIQSDGPAFVFIAKRKLESYTWVVPEDDVHLMKGVGAQTTSSEKNDDTFESLLLMIMDIDP